MLAGIGIMVGFLFGNLFFGETSDLQARSIRRPPKASFVIKADPNQPPGVVLPRGTQSVPVLRFFIESKKDASLQSIAVQRKGAGTTDFLSYGRLLANGKVIKEQHFSGSDHNVTWIDLNLKLKKNSATAFEVQVDFLPQVQSSLEYQFQLDAQDIRLRENFPVSGESINSNLFKIGNLTSDSITMVNPNAALKLPKSRSSDEIIARFTLKTGIHDTLLKRLVLTQDGNISFPEIKNIRLRYEGDTIAKASFQKYRLEFLPSDILMKKKKSYSFAVLADIGLPSKSEKIRLFLEKAEDVTAYDLEFSSGVSVVNQFDGNTAWCVGALSVNCPSEGFRRDCTRKQREENPSDC